MNHKIFLIKKKYHLIAKRQVNVKLATEIYEKEERTMGKKNIIMMPFTVIVIDSYVCLSIQM